MWCCACVPLALATAGSAIRRREASLLLPTCSGPDAICQATLDWPVMAMDEKME
jgi:hypothetical protein